MVTSIKTPHYKNIIFDLDIILIKWDPAGALDSIFYNSKQKPYAILDFVQNSWWHSFDRNATNEEELIKAGMTHFDIQERDLSIFLKRILYLLPPITQGIEIFYQVKQRGFSTYFLANLPLPFYRFIKNRYDFFNTCIGMIISSLVHLINPEKEIYQALLSQFSLKAEESIFIDDVEENIIAAQRGNITSVLCKHHSFVEQELKEKNTVITDFKKLKG